MKFTLWNQFSSNHSSHYTVVGQFPTEEAAQQAGEEVLEFLKSVGRWWQELAPWEKKENEKIANYYRDHLTPPEVEIAQKYNLTQYDQPLEWCGSEDAAMRAVAITKNLVVINNGWETYNSPRNFVELLTKMGSTAYYSWLEVQLISLSISCVFADKDAAGAAWNSITPSTTYKYDHTLGTKYEIPAYSVPTIEEPLEGTPRFESPSIQFPAIILLFDSYRSVAQLVAFLEQFSPIFLTFDITETEF